MVQIRQFSLRALDGTDDRIALSSVPAEVMAELKPALPEPVEPPPPSFSQEELEKARAEGRRQGYQEGMEAGLQQAKTAAAQLEQQVATCLGVIQAQMAQMVTQHANTLHERTEEVGRLAYAISRKVAGQALKTDPLAEIEAMAQSCLSLLAGKLSVQVRLHPDLVKAIEGRLRAQMEQMGITAELACVEDKELPQGDCRISWEQGEAQRDTGALWKNIEQLLGLENGIKTVPPAEDDEPHAINEN